MPDMAFDSFWPIVQILLEPFQDFFQTILAVVIFGIILTLFLRRIG